MRFKQSMNMLVMTAIATLAMPTMASEKLHKKLDQYMQTAANQGYVGGVLISKEGAVVYANQFGSLQPEGKDLIGPDTVTTVGSISKQFTAAGILKLQEMGKVSTQDKITKYFSNVPADKQNITIHHLLTHEAGFPGAIGGDRKKIGRDDFISLALATELLFVPGTGHEYSNVGYSLAAAIIELTTGQDYETFMYDNLFQPAGMEFTGYNRPDWDISNMVHGRTVDGDDWGTVYEHSIKDGGPGWHLMGNGGIHATAGDMKRWHEALNSNTVLNNASTKAMFSKHSPEPGGSYYGYGWSIEQSPWGELICHNGGNPFYFADYLRFARDDVMIFVWNVSQDSRMNQVARPLAEILFTGNVPDFPMPRPPLAKPGTGPAPEPGSLAAKWQLPGTDQGEHAAALLEAIRRDDKAFSEKVVQAHFSQKLIDKVGMEGLLDVIDQLRGDLAEFTFRGTRDSQGEYHVVLDGMLGVTTLLLILDPEDNQRIRGLGVEVGE